ncbi:MAG: hypothetical protein ACK4PI_06330 [Tepidisphaerales bacterium]
MSELPSATPEPTRPGRRKLASLRALGWDEPPATLEVDGRHWSRTALVKHDFFAATAFYEDGSGNKAVLKVGRTIPWCGVPLRWLGRLLRDREVRIYRKLADLPNVPKLLGTVGETGFLHAYVEGRPLERGKPVPDGFFARLEGLLRELHRRGIAYVDTNKPQNILLGDDGQPYLIDFQISWDGGPGWLLRRLQREDLYHLRKHWRRMRPDELTPEQLAAARQVGWWVRVHRAVTWPYFRVRRWLFRKLEKDGRLLPSGSD